MDNVLVKNENSSLKTIFSRRSVRQFTETTVSKSEINLILRAAMSAPTARNRQPWKFIVVDDREILDELAYHLPYAKMLVKAPLAIVVCGDLRNTGDETAQSFWVQDCSAAAENILIATEALGLGACWTACYPRRERENVVINTLNIPEHIIPLCVIPIGHPKFNTSIIDKWDEKNIIYNSF